jgi:hypothetical protein
LRGPWGSQLASSVGRQPGERSRARTAGPTPPAQSAVRNRTAGHFGSSVPSRLMNQRDASRADIAGHGPRVATVVLETSGNYDHEARLQATTEVVRKLAQATRGAAVVTFPGGWFQAGARKPMTVLESLSRAVGRILRLHGNGRLALSLGVDGRGGVDQLGVAIVEQEVVAMARKFHPAPGEEDTIDAADDWAAGEGGFPRIARLFGRTFFLAVCYDCFGIRHRHLPKPQVDAVLDHVHSFGRRGSRFGSGDALFARHGLAGASQEWGVPIFAGVRFIDRPIPAGWPSGVLWSGRHVSTMTWSYRKNGIQPEQTLSAETNAGRAVVRVFPPLARFPNVR